MNIDLILKVLFSHLLGDYVLQIDYIAKMKSSSLYHLFVHCALYCFPFYILCDMNHVMLVILFVSHILIDFLKARFNLIDESQDQALHYSVLILMFYYRI